MGSAFNYIRGLTVERRFWSKVDKRGSDECWEWLASLDTRGYGNFGVKKDGKFLIQRAHRVSWELTHGAGSAVGFVVCHACDNRKCVNPGHLFIGSQQDNMRDCVSKGRMNDRSGSSNVRAKLHPDAVLEIRSSPLALSVLASRYGVSKSTVQSARSGKSWLNV